MVKKFILKFHHLSDHDEEEEIEEDDNPNKMDNVLDIFKIEGNLFDFETPLYEAFYEFNYLLRIDTNGETKWPTCTSDIDGLCNGGELLGMVRVGNITYFQDHTWYDELVDGKLKDETLELKAKIEGSWGDATPRVMKFYEWLKNSFENFHELDYEILVKLQEFWWKVNAHKIALFTRMKNFERGEREQIDE
ncbi:hypothetical protein Tco_0892676 [Tanacetum coccineum]|uniref:Uncharacterized protein n=1 Tax=Tanacetum coccineum TaxID=301880 RepID=A0ABQ5CBZ0_9ASTR